METRELVNFMLREIQASELDSSVNLATAGPLVETALRTIRQVSHRIQSEGWWFNRFWDVPLLINSHLFDPMVRNQIWLLGHPLNPPTRPNGGMIAISSYHGQYAIRDWKLYDMWTRSFTMKGTVCLRFMVVEFYVEDCPLNMGEYIKYVAAEEFVRSELGDTVRMQLLNKAGKEALVALKRENIRALNMNAMDSPSVRRVLSGREPFKGYV